jgi:hypothetical protein
MTASLPPLLPLDVASLKSAGKTCFIGILGFERRCSSAAKALAQKGWRADAVLPVHYAHAEMQEANERHKEEFYQSLRSLGGNVSHITLEHSDHDLNKDFGYTLLEGLRELGLDTSSADTHVILDITVGSSRLLLEGLHALLSSSVNVTLIYSEVADYRPAFGEYQSYLENQHTPQVTAPEFLTVGVDKVELLRRIPGVSADPRAVFLVVFPSFAPTRVLGVIEELSPSRVHWMFGIPHLVRNRWRLDAQREYHRHLIERLHRSCYVSTFDYRETFEVLETVYRKRQANYAVLVCSLGSKLQKVGQVLFHLLRPETGAIAVIPRAWNPDGYSGEQAIAVHMLRLGPAAQLRRYLWGARRLRV